MAIRPIWVLTAALFLRLFLATADARELRLEIASDHPSAFQVFYGQAQFDYIAANSVSAAFPGDGQFHELRFAVPDWDNLDLRLDPGAEPANIQIRAIRLYDANGGLLGSVSPNDLHPLQQIEAIKRDPVTGTISFTVPAGDHDPNFVINEFALETALHGRHHISRTPFLITFFLLLAATLAGLGIGVAWCLSPARGTRRVQLLVGAGILFLVAGIRLTELSDKVSWAPYLDEFEGELATVIRPFLGNALEWPQFFAPHNDHRIATTRVVSLATFLVNGEWDNRVLAVVNCLLQATGVAWFAIFAWRELSRLQALLLTGFLVLSCTLVNDWANLIVGFQLQFHFILLSSFATLLLLPNARPGSLPSWVGFAAGVFATASMGSGFTALVAGVAGLLARAWLDRRLLPVIYIIVLLSLGLSVFAWQTRAIFVAHDYLHAKDVHEWLLALWTYGAWPFPPAAPWFILMWLPWTALVAQMAWRRQATAFQIFLFSMGSWLLLQIVALSYGRAGFAPIMSSRYTGMLVWSAVTALASFASLEWPAGTTTTRPRRPPAWSNILVGAVLLGFLASCSFGFFGPQLKGFRVETREQEQRLGTFMHDDNPRVFTEVDFPHKPYPIDDRLVFLMRDPIIREALPAPLRREAYRSRDTAALLNVRTGPLTWLARVALQSGPVLLIAAALCLAWALKLVRRPDPPAAAVP